MQGLYFSMPVSLHEGRDNVDTVCALPKPQDRCDGKDQLVYRLHDLLVV